MVRVDDEARAHWLAARQRLPCLLALFLGVGPVYSALNQARSTQTNPRAGASHSFCVHQEK
jgi:hypothetical protein